MDLLQVTIWRLEFGDGNKIFGKFVDVIIQGYIVRQNWVIT